MYPILVIGYVSRTHQIAALRFVSRSHQSDCCIKVCISHQSYIIVFEYLAPITAFGHNFLVIFCYKITMFAYRVVCCYHQSDCCIWISCTNHGIWVLFSHKWCHVHKEWHQPEILDSLDTCNVIVAFVRASLIKVKIH